MTNRLENFSRKKKKKEITNHYLSIAFVSNFLSFLGIVEKLKWRSSCKSYFFPFLNRHYWTFVTFKFLRLQNKFFGFSKRFSYSVTFSRMLFFCTSYPFSSTFFILLPYPNPYNFLLFSFSFMKA